MSETEKGPPPAPAGLGERGGALWVDIAGMWSLRADELRVLEAAARTADDLERLEAELASADLVVSGHAGQPRTNPLVGSVAVHRGLLAKLLRQLALPDDDAGTVPARVSATKAAAARVRWDRERALGVALNDEAGA